VAPFERPPVSLRALVAAHVTLELVNRGRLRLPDDVERDRLMRVAAETLHLEVTVSCVQRVAESWRGLGRALEAQHARIPGLAGQAIGILAGVPRALGEDPHG